MYQNDGMISQCTPSRVVLAAVFATLGVAAIVAIHMGSGDLMSPQTASSTNLAADLKNPTINLATSSWSWQFVGTGGCLDASGHHYERLCYSKAGYAWRPWQGGISNAECADTAGMLVNSLGYNWKSTNGYCCVLFSAGASPVPAQSSLESPPPTSRVKDTGRGTISHRTDESRSLRSWLCFRRDVKREGYGDDEGYGDGAPNHAPTQSPSWRNEDGSATTYQPTSSNGWPYGSCGANMWAKGQQRRYGCEWYGKEAYNQWDYSFRSMYGDNQYDCCKGGDAIANLDTCHES
jgi:hypothetical protein